MKRSRCTEASRLKIHRAGITDALPGADRDARHRVIGHDNRDPCDLAKQRVEPAQQRPAAPVDHAAVNDVGGELGRRLLEHGLDRFDDRLHRLRQRLGTSST